MAADFYTWTNPNSYERKVIEAFLSIAQKRIDNSPASLPFKSQAGNRTLAWLRGILDRKPSELGLRDKDEG